MSKEVVYSTQIIDHVEIIIDDQVPDDEVHIDYFFPRRTHRFTVELKAKNLLPELFEPSEKK